MLYYVYSSLYSPVYTQLGAIGLPKHTRDALSRVPAGHFDLSTLNAPGRSTTLLVISVQAVTSAHVGITFLPYLFLSVYRFLGHSLCVQTE